MLYLLGLVIMLCLVLLYEHKDYKDTIKEGGIYRLSLGELLTIIIIVSLSWFAIIITAAAILFDRMKVDFNKPVIILRE